MQVPAIRRDSWVCLRSGSSWLARASRASTSSAHSRRMLAITARSSGTHVLRRMYPRRSSRTISARDSGVWGDVITHAPRTFVQYRTTVSAVWNPVGEMSLRPPVVTIGDPVEVDAKGENSQTPAKPYINHSVLV